MSKKVNCSFSGVFILRNEQFTNRDTIYTLSLIIPLQPITISDRLALYTTNSLLLNRLLSIKQLLIPLRRGKFRFDISNWFILNIRNTWVLASINSMNALLLYFFWFYSFFIHYNNVRFFTMPELLCLVQLIGEVSYRAIMWTLLLLRMSWQVNVN